jgi:hypothetical protein
MAQEVEHLPSKCKALSSNSSTAKSLLEPMHHRDVISTIRVHPHSGFYRRKNNSVN